MPTINRTTNKKKADYKKHGNNALVSKIYSSQAWQKLRNAYLMQFPLCEECLNKGIITPADEVHHIQPILTGKDYYEMQAIALNPDNLKSLCSKCHHEIHNQMK
jgi:5-methylcytosine-specific restriction protein A